MKTITELQAQVRREDGITLLPGMCPDCNGEGWHTIGPGVRLDGDTDKHQDCDACDGTGFVATPTEDQKP